MTGLEFRVEGGGGEGVSLLGERLAALYQWTVEPLEFGRSIRSDQSTFVTIWQTTSGLFPAVRDEQKTA